VKVITSKPDYWDQKSNSLTVSTMWLILSLTYEWPDPGK